jgi:hypothetical protein
MSTKIFFAGIFSTVAVVLSTSHAVDEYNKAQLKKDLAVFSGQESKINESFVATGKGLVNFEMPGGKKCRARITGDIHQPNFQLMSCD